MVPSCSKEPWSRGLSDPKIQANADCQPVRLPQRESHQCSVGIRRAMVWGFPRMPQGHVVRGGADGRGVGCAVDLLFDVEAPSLCCGTRATAPARRQTRWGSGFPGVPAGGRGIVWGIHRDSRGATLRRARCRRRNALWGSHGLRVWTNGSTKEQGRMSRGLLMSPPGLSSRQHQNNKAQASGALGPESASRGVTAEGHRPTSVGKAPTAVV